MASGVSYYTRTPLIFYNNKTEAIPDITVKEARPTKPKRELNATDNKFEIELAKWDAKEVKKVDIKVRGNAITQYYYTQKILPYYLQELDNMRAKFGCGTVQEDGDPSHGTKSTWNYAWRIKRQRDVLRHLLTHSPRLTVRFQQLEPNCINYENTNYIRLKLGLIRYNFRVGL